MTQPPSGIGAVALADLLGHWPAADGPLYRLLATRIARLAAANCPPGSGCRPNVTWPVAVEDPTFPGVLDALHRAAPA
jgi:hypothetical protein